MKRNVKGTLVTVLLMASLCLEGCGIIGTDHTGNTVSGETLKTNESTVQIDIDVYRMLENAEQEASVLQKRLTEDASLTQNEMNILSPSVF